MNMVLPKIIYGRDGREKATDLYISVMLLVFPVFTGFSGYGAITSSKFFFFAVCSLLWLCAVVYFSLREKLPIPRLTVPQLLAGVFAVFLCISALLSADRDTVFLGAGRFDGLATWLLYILAFYGVSAFGRFRPFHAALFAVAVCVCCIIAIIQLCGRNPLWLFPSDYTYYDAHVKYTSEFLGTIGNVNLLSAFLCLSVPLFFSLPVLCNRPVSRLCYLPLFLSVFVLAASKVSGGAVALGAFFLIAGPVLVCETRRLKPFFLSACVCALALCCAVGFSGIMQDGSLLLSFTFSRLCIVLAIVAAVLALLAACPIGKIKIGSRPLRICFMILSVLTLVGAAIFIWCYPDSSGTLYELSQAMRGHLEDSYGSSRILIWRKTLALAFAHPIFGGGPGTLALHIDILFSRFVPLTGQTLTAGVDNAHNVYLQVLADGGFAGLAAYAAFLISCFARFGRRGGSGLQIAAGLCVFCYCVQDFFGLGLCLSAPVFWIILGLFQARN